LGLLDLGSGILSQLKEGTKCIVDFGDTRWSVDTMTEFREAWVLAGGISVSPVGYMQSDAVTPYDFPGTFNFFGVGGSGGYATGSITWAWGRSSRTREWIHTRTTMLGVGTGWLPFQISWGRQHTRIRRLN
jgi:hypothetical protein